VRGGATVRRAGQGVEVDDNLRGGGGHGSLAIASGGGAGE
jgi:hypothetical protein